MSSLFVFFPSPNLCTVRVRKKDTLRENNERSNLSRICSLPPQERYAEEINQQSNLTIKSCSLAGASGTPGYLAMGTRHRSPLSFEMDRILNRLLRSKPSTRYPCLCYNRSDPMRQIRQYLTSFTRWVLYTWYVLFQTCKQARVM